MKKEVLQEFLNKGVSYFIGRRYVKGYNSPDSYQTVFISPIIEKELLHKKIEDLPFGVVEEFNNREILSNIFFGKSYEPFQYGIRIKDFIEIYELECGANELIHFCYENDITDYHEIIKIMKSLIKI